MASQQSSASSESDHDLFAEIDRNGDGVITRAEFEKRVRAGGFPSDVAEDLRSRFDLKSNRRGTAQLRSSSLPPGYVMPVSQQMIPMVQGVPQTWLPTSQTTLPRSQSMMQQSQTMLPGSQVMRQDMLQTLPPAASGSSFRASSLPPRLNPPMTNASMPMASVFPGGAPPPTSSQALMSQPTFDASGAFEAYGGSANYGPPPVASGTLTPPPTAPLAPPSFPGVPPQSFMPPTSSMACGGSANYGPPLAASGPVAPPPTAPLAPSQPSLPYAAAGAPWGSMSVLPMTAPAAWGSLSLPPMTGASLPPSSLPPVAALETTSPRLSPPPSEPMAAPLNMATPSPMQVPSMASHTLLAPQVAPPPAPVTAPTMVPPSPSPLPSLRSSAAGAPPSAGLPELKIPTPVPTVPRQEATISDFGAAGTDPARPSPISAFEPAGSTPTDELFNALDRNADGVITRDEYMLGASGQHSQASGVPPYQMKSEEGEEKTSKPIIDLDVDGLDPTPEELFLYRDLDGEVTNGPGEIFGLIDRNDDGIITKEEFMKAFQGNTRITLRPGMLQRSAQVPPKPTDVYQQNSACVSGGVNYGSDFSMPGMSAPDLKMPGMSAPDWNMPGMSAPDWNMQALGLELPEVELTWVQYLCGCLFCDVFGCFSCQATSCARMCEGEGCGVRAGMFQCVGCCGRACGTCGGEYCDAACENCEACCDHGIIVWCAACCGLGPGASSTMSSSSSYLFPWFFTFLCFVLFASPIMLTYFLGQDMQVRYWISDQLRVVLLLPLLYIFTQLCQSLKRAPSRILACICLVGSCAFFLVLGDLILLSASQKANALQAKDCNTDLDKQQLELQWQNAELFYSQCMSETAASTASSLEVSYSLYRIQDCVGYSEQLDKNPAWPYLGALEQNYNCGGWCTPSQPLWTFKAVKDSCSLAVADVLHNKVKRTMFMVLGYSAVVLLVVSVGLIQAGPILRSHGVAWK